jgi:predicted dehydrogenase
MSLSSVLPSTYAPGSKPGPVVAPGEFVFAAAHLDHGHIYNQTQGLLEAGGTLTWVYEPDPVKLAKFTARFPSARVARSLDEILADPAVRLVAAAAIPCDRGPLGCRVLRAGKHYFTDKAPLTTLAQLAEARATVAATGKKFAVYYSERLHVECAVHANTLIALGAIGRVVQVLGLGPHRLNAPIRPAWFFEKNSYGGILCDIGSHQFEQFLHYTGATDATILHAAVANYAHRDHPNFEDFGEASLLGNNGAANYVRVDWFTPAGLSTWGDGRTIILGTEGTIELRKYLDVARAKTTDHLIIVDAEGEHHLELQGQVGFPFFGQLIRDCLEGTETAMTQAHAFKAAELCIKAQLAARNLTP